MFLYISWLEGLSKYPLQSITRAIWYGCKNHVAPGCWATKFCVVAANIFNSITALYFSVSSILNLLHVTLPARKIWRQFLDFGKFQIPAIWNQMVIFINYDLERMQHEAVERECLISGIFQSDGWCPNSDVLFPI